MKLMSSARTIAAAISRSPSFSRSSSSMTMTIRPARRSASTSSIESSRVPSSFNSVTFDKTVLLQARPADAAGLRHQSFEIARDDVDLQVDARPGAVGAEHRRRLGVRHDVDAERAALDLVDRQAHAVD